MLTTKFALATTALIASSSVAMADSTFSISGRATATWSTSPSRTYPAPVRYETYPRPSYQGPIVRDHRTHERDDRRWVDDRRYDAPHTTVSPTGYRIDGMDCRNWDPVRDLDSPCNVFASTAPELISYHAGADHHAYGPWTTLASREASVPDVEYITVERSLRQLRIDVVTGQPALTSVAFKFADGGIHKVNLRRMSRGSTVIDVPGNGRRTISQIVFYSADRSHGVYTVSAM